MEERYLREYIIWRIRQLNKEKDKTCEQLEFETGLNLSRIMRGENSNTDRTKSKIYKFYGITPDEFYRAFPEFIAELNSQKVS